MFRVDNDSAVAIMPAATSAGSPGYFTDGNPATGQPATVLSAEFMNMVMMELANLVTDSGQTLAKNDYKQVSKAVQAMIASLSTVSWDHVTDKPVDWSVAGKTALTGAVTLASTLTVAGASTLQGTLGVTGAATLASSLSVGTTATITGAALLKSSLAVIGAATLSSSLSVGTTLNVASTAYVASLVVNAGAQLKGALTVATTAIITGAATLSSTLAVTGATTLSSTLSVAGATTLSSTLSVTGAVTCASELQSTAVNAVRMVSTTGQSVILRNEGANFYILTSSLADPYGTFNSARPFSIQLSTGKVYLGAGVLVAGGLTTDVLSVTGITTLAGAATLSSTLAVTGAATLSSSLTVATTATITGAVALKSTLTVAGMASFAVRPTFNGYTAWDNGNFTPSAYARVATTLAGYGITDAVLSTTYATDKAAAAVSVAAAAKASIGYNQTWQDVTDSRAASTTYTNTTGKPIVLSISAYTTSKSASYGMIYVAINGENMCWTSGTAAGTVVPINASVIVPPGATYSATFSASSWTWWELR